MEFLKVSAKLIVPDRFDSIESAERCIVTLRKYRNLHPSFSKV